MTDASVPGASTQRVLGDSLLRVVADRDALTAEVNQLRSDNRALVARLDKTVTDALRDGTRLEREARRAERRRIESEIVGPLLDLSDTLVFPDQRRLKEAQEKAERWRTEVKREQGGDELPRSTGGDWPFSERGE